MRVNMHRHTPEQIQDAHQRYLAIVKAERAAATPPPAVPGFLQRAGNFAAAAVQHVAAGSPRCTDEQVAARHAICAGCEYFDGKLCTKCGCPVSRERTYMGKLSWADQSCPVGKWGPENPG
jgi:hypothetical protein